MRLLPGALLPTRCPPTARIPLPGVSVDAERGEESEESVAEDPVDQKSSGGFKAALPAAVILLAALGATAWGIVQLAPEEAPDKRDPSFVDSIFANVVVIAAARVLLLVAAVVLLVALVYIGSSVVARLARGEWLRRAGPFEANLKEAAEGLDEADDFFDEWLEATNEKEELLEVLEQRDDAIRELLADRAALLEELERRSGT